MQACSREWGAIEVVGRECNRVERVGNGGSEEEDNREVVEEEESNTTTRVVREVEVRWIEMSTMGGDETRKDFGVGGNSVVVAVDGETKVVSGGK